MKLRMYEIVQRLDYIDNLKEFLNVIHTNDAIEKFAYIVHDKDKGVEPHLHLAVRLKDSYDSKYVAQWFGVKEQYLSKVKGRFKDLLSYLTHKNAIDKYQYSDDEVISNFDWVAERGAVGKSGYSKRVEDIINGIVDMKIREYNIGDLLSPVEEVRYCRQINEAYKIRDRKLMLRGDRVMECIFITGKSGSGKTTYAKKIADDKGYSYFVSGSSNDALDGYLGQDCIILDDLRSSSFSLSDLLKMLDNNTNSSVKSRYRNKVLQCKLLIITSVLSIDQFYKNVFESSEEPIIQFKRRCKMYIEMEEKTLSIRLFDNVAGKYSKAVSMPNPIYLMYPKKELTGDEALAYLKDMLVGANEFFEENGDMLKREFDEQREKDSVLEFVDEDYMF